MNVKNVNRNLRLLRESLNGECAVCLHIGKTQEKKWVKYVAGVCVVDKSAADTTTVVLHPLYSVGLGYYADSYFSASETDAIYARKFCNVSELIAILDKVNDEAIVYMDMPEATDVVLSVCADEESIFFQDETDFDIALELEDAFSEMEKEPDVYKTGYSTWLSFYSSLLSDGITIAMIRKYVGDDEADAMEKFCNEHKKELDQILAL